MSKSYLQHLQHFINLPRSSLSPISSRQLTLLSALKGSLSLGLNFPASVVHALRLRCSLSPSWAALSPFRPLLISHIPAKIRPDVSLDLSSFYDGRGLSADDLFSAYRKSGRQLDRDVKARRRDEQYLRFFHRIAARPDGKVRKDDVELLNSGRWAEDVVKRRSRRSDGDILPFSRGGPIGVAGHSWFVGQLFGVGVYAP